MNENSIIILPEGTEISDDIKLKAEIVGFLQEDGSLKVGFNKHEGPDVFKNMSEFFRYISDVRKNA